MARQEKQTQKNPPMVPAQELYKNQRTLKKA